MKAEAKAECDDLAFADGALDVKAEAKAECGDHASADTDADDTSFWI